MGSTIGNGNTSDKGKGSEDGAESRFEGRGRASGDTIPGQKGRSPTFSGTILSKIGEIEKLVSFLFGRR